MRLIARKFSALLMYAYDLPVLSSETCMSQYVGYTVPPRLAPFEYAIPGP